MNQEDILKSIRLGKAVDLHTLLDKGIYGLPADASFINGPDFTDDATISVTPIYRGDGTTAIIHELTSSGGDKYVEIGELSTKTWSEWTAIGGGGSGGKGPKGDTGLGYANFSSNSDVTLNVGSITITTNLASNKTAYTVGNYIKLASSANPTKNYAVGYITAFSGTDLTVLITGFTGSGTFNDWIISIAGEQGPAGKDGANGKDGKDGTNGKDGAQGAKGDQGPEGKQGPKGDPGEGTSVLYEGKTVTALVFGNNIIPSIDDNGVLTIDAISGGSSKSQSFDAMSVKGVIGSGSNTYNINGSSIGAFTFDVNAIVPFIIQLDRVYKSGEKIKLSLVANVIETSNTACNITDLTTDVYAGISGVKIGTLSAPLSIVANEFSLARKISTVDVTFTADTAVVIVNLTKFTGATTRKAGFFNDITFNWS